MTPAQLSVWVPGRPPTPNERYGNVHAQRKVTKQWREDARKLGVDASNRAGWRTPAQVRLVITFVVPDHQRRDWDNLVAGTKPLTDGLVDAKVLPDDDVAHVVEVSYRVRLERGIAGTQYVIHAVDTDTLGLLP